MDGRPSLDVVDDFDRYRRVGLSANPFRARGEKNKFEPETGIWFVDRGLPHPPPPGSATMVQVIGDQGLGKSTHLAEWRRLQPGPFHYIPRRPYRDRRHPPPVAAVVYGDEIDRMPGRLRAQWFRRLAALEATVVIGTHRDLSTVARRAGLAVRTHHLRPASRIELREVLEARLRAAATRPGQVPAVTFTDGDVDLIHARSGGNLRVADTISHRILAERVRQVVDNV